jgi:hypothetical protein
MSGCGMYRCAGVALSVHTIIRAIAVCAGARGRPLYGLLLSFCSRSCEQIERVELSNVQERALLPVRTVHEAPSLVRSIGPSHSW